MRGRAVAAGTAVTAMARMIAACSACQSAAVDFFAAAIEAVASSAWPDVAWQFSRLTQDGCPVEFAFSSDDDAFRYTVEVAGPEVAEHERLAAACSLLAHLRQPLPRPDALQFWHRLQSGSALRWGAWLGARHDLHGDTMKLYVEVPRTAPAPVDRSLPMMRLTGARLRMIGYEPVTGRTECYFSKSPFDLAELDALLSSVGRAQQREQLVTGLEEICGLPIRSALRWMGIGYSLAGLPDTGARQLGIFLRAKAVSGGARAVRRALLAAAACAGRRVFPYATVTSPIADWDLPDHGVVTLGIRSSSGLEYRVGISGQALARCAGRLGP